ncbi:hypothetical protein K1719_035092 [Acacia pycnantha]|nr:hypothetical protein K1719_035092 [Acacia pycnantha]
MCWWEWVRTEEDDKLEDYGADTDFAKVLNSADGIRVDYSDPLCPRFEFEEKERERLWKPFSRTLVVKLLGRQLSYGFMLKKLRQLWERKGSIEVFDSWVRLPDLPAPLFDKKFLLNLGNSIGKAIRLDIHTAQRARGKFVRMCVELDLTKPLVPEFNVEGQILSVEYESLGSLCSKCGRVRHNQKNCDNFHKRSNEGGMDIEDEGEHVVKEVNNGGDGVSGRLYSGGDA